MCTLHQDSSASPPTLELCAFHALRPKHLDFIVFRMLPLLPGIVCLVKLDTLSQPLHLKPLRRPVWISLRRAEFYLHDKGSRITNISLRK